MTRFCEQSSTVIDAAVIDELRKAGTEVEYWDTGGGCMMVAAVISRLGGTPETRMGEPTGRSHATRYVGVTHDGPESGWMVFRYDEQSDDPRDYDGVDVLAMLPGLVIDPDRPDLVAAFVSGYVRGEQEALEPRLAARTLRDRPMPGRE